MLSNLSYFFSVIVVGDVVVPLGRRHIHDIGLVAVREAGVDDDDDTGARILGRLFIHLCLAHRAYVDALVPLVI